MLDRDKALVVQPDIIFVASDRLHLVRDRVWGAPDLVGEVLSPRTAGRDLTIELRWYRRYGVKECWLVDPKTRRIEVVDLQEPATGRKTFSGRMPVRSHVLPEFGIALATFIE